MKPIAVVLIVAGVIVVICLFGARYRLGLVGTLSKQAVDVQLTMQGGVCKVKDPVDTLGGGWKFKLRWDVRNVDCPEPQYVGFMEYRERLSGGGLGSPELGIVESDPAYSRRIATGGSDSVGVKIEKFNWNPFSNKTYKYKICTLPSLNPATNCLDPDVDVWPF